MHNRYLVRTLALALVALALPFWLASSASAHEERESQFPPGKGKVPAYRAISQAKSVIVVCKADSGSRISKIRDVRLRSWNKSLLKRCKYRHLQAAVDAVRVQRTNIYVLPGVYREQPSWNPACAKNYDGGVVSYRLIVTCGEVVNLVTVAGDSPKDPDIVCDNRLCNLQIQGTGATPGGVLFTGGFKKNGDWVKHNGIKADRADGFFLKNMTLELFRENAVYVHETDGYAMDDVVTRKNDLYGVLTFTSDHGKITDCEAYHNGDSGIYPGSAADVNAQSNHTGPLRRWAVEISRCDVHHNTLAFSGTAGNSVYLHHNDVHHNGMGVGFESILSGHPGMPQDHAWIQHNVFRSNNTNYYGNVKEGGPCQAAKPVDRGHQRGVVCPALPMPVGTGVFLVGNHNYVHSNQFYDNWRSGVKLFWVPPAALRGDYDPTHQFDNSNHNAFTNNEMGFTRGGRVLPNGLDFWWDDAGVGNCWQDNLAAQGKKITHNATGLPALPGLPAVGGLPECGNPSQVPPSNVVKTTQMLPCAEYDRYSNPEPAGCDWIVTPPRPGARTGSMTTAGIGTLPGDDLPGSLALIGLGGAFALGAWLVRRRRQELS